MASDSFAPGALLSAYIDDTLEMLDSDDVLDYFRDKNDLDENLLNKLIVSLSSINLVMDDAENKHFSDKHKQVRRWLHKVRDAVHDAEDLLDEIQTEASKSKLLAAEFQTTSSAVSSFDKEVQSRMKKVLDNLESLASQKDSLGLEKSNSGGAKYVSQRLPATSLVDESAIWGREDDKKIIIDWLLSDNDNGSGGNNLTVISIVGMGGLGKTTLAQLVYNDSRMNVNDGVSEFQLKAWVCVSENFDVIKVTRTILEALNLPTSGRENLNTLQVQLKEKLTGKKFFLVLDDVWEEKNKMWEALQAPLLYGARGSKILVTTRSEKVASIMRCAHVYQLKKLSEEQSWLLFAKHALYHANSTFEFEEIGRKIIKKCNGLPLALKAIGSLLHDNSSYEEWNRILTSQMWEISDSECDIIPALRLSYQFLSSPLKRCFAYCSLIPKDYEFDKDWLVQLWMAENFLPIHQQNQGMKELGDRFFNDLLSRSFFQRSTSKEELFVMHDLVNDLAKYVSRDFCLRLKEEKEAKSTSRLTRHISCLGRNFMKGSEQFEAIYKGNKLRTILRCDSRIILVKMLDDLLCQCKCLRALSLYFHHQNFALPNSIGNLKHLRYLDLSNCYEVYKLPDSTCLLYNLQTMKLENCCNLKELPSDIHKLVNLLHLDLRRTKVRELPDGMRKLKKLEILLMDTFYVGKCGESNINQLGELPLQGKLSINQLQNVVDPMDALAANLKNKIHLQELRLNWVSSSGEMKGDGYEIKKDVLENLQPPANLKELCIEYYGGTRFPDWLGNNNNIVSLELLGCKYCVSLPPLWMLTSLKKLRISGIEGIKSISAEFYGNLRDSSSSSTAPAPAPFRSLQFLEFRKMERWEEWDCENTSSSSSSGTGTGAAFPFPFPCLEEIIISDCPRLKTKLPQHLPSLMRLRIGDCPLLVGAYEKELPGSSYTRLHTLEIWYCRDLEIQIQGHPLFNSLRSLVLNSWDTVEAFPLYLFPKLQELRLSDCRNLERLDDGSGGATGGVTSPPLTELTITRCPKFVSISSFSISFASLTVLRLTNCPKFVTIPETRIFPSLTVLMLDGCRQMEWPEEGGGGFPSTLERLEIEDCPKLLASHNKWDLHTLTSLTHLEIRDDTGHGNFVDCKRWSLPPNLEWLNGLSMEVQISYGGYFCQGRKIAK